jgi:hypothetical protein
MTEWLALIIIVPMILVPIVLLWGFAGCGSFGAAPGPPPDPKPPAPFNLKAVALSTTQILLTWEHSSAGGVTFFVGRQRLDGTWDDGHGVPTPDTAKTFTDTLPTEGEFHTYRVQAAPAGATSNKSDPSTPASARAFGKAFEATLTTGRQRRDRCIIQRIEPARLSRTGKRVQITLRRSSDGDVVINRLYISQPAGFGDPYDAGADLTPVVTAPLLLPMDPGNSPFPLPIVNYALDHTKPLLLAFDIGSAGNVRDDPSAPTTDATAFVGPLQNPPLHEASSPNRQPLPTYNAESRIYLVSRIDVA